jgi:hypothetical protein
MLMLTLSWSPGNTEISGNSGGNTRQPVKLLCFRGEMQVTPTNAFCVNTTVQL